MQNYELVLVLPGGSSAAKKSAVTERLEKMVKVSKGKVAKKEDWGEKELAYKIKKQNSGVFVIFDLELSSDGAKTIEGKLRLMENVIRYLFIRKERS